MILFLSQVNRVKYYVSWKSMSCLRKDLKKKKESNNKDDNTNTKPMNEGKTNMLLVAFLYFLQGRILTKSLEKD